MRTLRDPVVASDGITYERSRITEWFGMSTKSPSTNLVLSNTSVVPNLNLRNVMREVKTFIGKRKREALESGEPKSEEGLWVYRVKRAVSLHRAPTLDFGLVVNDDEEGGLRTGQVISANLKVTLTRGVIFVKLEGAEYWVPVVAENGNIVLEEVGMVHPIAPWVFRCSTKKVKIRYWPDYESREVGKSIRRDEFVKTFCMVTGEHGDAFVRIESEGVLGWIFVSRKGKRLFQQVSEKSIQEIKGPGFHINVLLTGTEGNDGVFLVANPGPGFKWNRDQIFHSGIKSIRLHKRLQKFKANAQIIDSILLASDGLGGVPNHVWTGNLEPSIATLIKHDSIFAFGIKDQSTATRPYVVINKDGTFEAANIRPSLLELLTANSGSVKSLFLAENGEFFVSLGDKCVWEFKDWELCQALERGSVAGNLVSMAMSPGGRWIVLCEDRFETDHSASKELISYLHEFYTHKCLDK
ncbi:hypothetical protein BCR33DRAFT_711585 [Rhizoclosmatium globosum]|uniref:U-box domain-containing protein n=1 Tax=Rhizoclosmatium globosum TaxID=329046 RepID=A0A1Y2D2B4_9FUNG|nr:hypothetical protein BCR33DRAFT_711585 [Rhizoclosmatium globosum]|eukprot:ORY53256.1 hypothetical protein BCR33DRAFT_711585 [Rhizoclosmatium globosum]